MIARRGASSAEAVDVSAGLLLGVDPERERRSEQVRISPGDALAFYTDGLVERRKRSSPRIHAERLGLVRRAFVASDDAETACTRIIAQGLGDDSVEDDVALVVVRRQ